MIKWPEPICYRVKWSKIGGGSSWVLTDKPLLEKEGFTNEALHNRSQLKQAVRDFGEQCAQACAAEAEGRGDEDAFVAKLCAAAIRALIKEIE